MGRIERGPFPLGWTPDADAVDAPPGCLLRGDNLILDELHILSLRRGCSKLDTDPLPDTDIHSLHTQALAGTRYRMVGASSPSQTHVYANGVQLPQLIDGDGDVNFGTHMGQIFYARGSSKYKYDGTDVLNWGILQTGSVAIVAPGAGGVTNSTELISADIGETPAIEFEVDDGTGPTYTDDRNGVSAAALDVHTDKTSFTGQAYFHKIWPVDQDLTLLGTGNVPATDDSILSFWAFFQDPTKVFQISVQISVNGPTIWSDEYASIWFISELAQAGTVVPGWNKLSVRRGDMVRGGPGTPNTGWNTVRMVRVVMVGHVDDPGEMRFDELKMSGTTSGSPLNGSWRWAYTYVRDNGSYIAYSALSDPSEPTHIDGTSAEVTIPADINRDSQVNQIWVYRMGENLETWYRTAVYNPGTSVGTGAIVITDSMTDSDALDLNIKADLDTDVPPNGIIGIEGPYYDRLFVLTPTNLYPSRKLSPDNFAITQVIRVAGPDEIALWVKKAYGGLYIGTTKDIYRLSGTGAELPDDTTEFTFEPLNIDNPPRNPAVAQEGSLLCYVASDGWRAFTGAGSQPLSGATSLLYQGQNRHGLGSINTATGRFRAAICKSQLVASTPEGEPAANSHVLYRYNFKHPQWYRHYYPAAAYRSIFREPDGTLIAGDDAGFVRILDIGDTDDGAAIPVLIWTPKEDGGDGFAPKQGSNLSLNLDSGGAAFQVQVVTDDDNVVDKTLTGSTPSMQPVAFDISDLATFHQLQLRIMGDFTRFRLSKYVTNCLTLPRAVRAWDSGPLNLGVQDVVWARRVRMKVRAYADLIVTPYFDGEAFPTLTIPIGNSAGKTTQLDVPIGRGFFGLTPRFLVQSSQDFHPYWVELLPRLTQKETEKKPIRMAAGLGGEEAS